MKAEVTTQAELVSVTQTFHEEKGMITVLKVETKLQPGEIARILNFRRQGASLNITLGSDQLMFDLVVEATEIDVPAKDSRL